MSPSRKASSVDSWVKLSTKKRKPRKNRMPSTIVAITITTGRVQKEFFLTLASGSFWGLAGTFPLCASSIVLPNKHLCLADNLAETGEFSLRLLRDNPRLLEDMDTSQ